MFNFMVFGGLAGFCGPSGGFSLVSGGVGLGWSFLTLTSFGPLSWSCCIFTGLVWPRGSLGSWGCGLFFTGALGTGGSTGLVGFGFGSLLSLLVWFHIWFPFFGL